MTWQINAWFINHCPAFICPCFTLCLHHMSRNQTNEVLNGSRGTGVRSCWLLSRSPLSLSNNSTVLKTQQGQFVYIFVTQSNIWPRKKSLPLGLVFVIMLCSTECCLSPYFFFLYNQVILFMYPLIPSTWYDTLLVYAVYLRQFPQRLLFTWIFPPKKIRVFLLNNFKNWCQ